MTDHTLLPPADRAAPSPAAPAPTGRAPAVLVVGEALADVLDTPDGRRAHPGGSPANTALGLARLGHQAHLATRLGDDAYGSMIRDHLARDGVTLTPDAVGDRPTSTATAVLDDEGRATYTFDIFWDLSPTVTELIGEQSFEHLHAGSVAALLEPGAARVLALVRGAPTAATISYDPNLRPALLAAPGRERPRVERLVALSDVVKVSDEDLDWLYPGEDAQEIAAAWARRGPALVVLTRGTLGASAHWRHGRHDVAAAPVEVADTIGAGDAFMSGLISGLLEGGLLGAGRFGLVGATSTEQPSPALVAALERAARTAALTCARHGADPPTRAELAAFDL
ncbi:carbohydrate kinase [Kitasatospora sp. NPDC058190]|uniref:carbohydrate kinase family protein n=1 Tax=Kitasatospora sp. NPDC058190 TaxID=3346371 RepID=UPI0036DA89C3